VKILTGRLRGQTILFKPNPHLRPTSDKARKAIFDMLQGALEDKRVLDLFSGTGALGLEALSQGASHVTFVEQDAGQCKKIGENLERLGLTRSARVESGDAVEWLRKPARRQNVFDFVFMDPPYAALLALETLESISKAQVLAPGAFVVLECRKREDMPERCGDLVSVREKRYGQTKLTVYAASPGSRGSL
jgi:16S rRNA (guanine966-N2)-methyltransferase